MKGESAGVLEIPRNVTANIWKLVLGNFLVGICVLVVIDDADRVDRVSRGIPIIALFGVPGILLIASNVHLLLRRPPWLRATSAGVWFGGGPIIPWQEIKSVYEAGVPIVRYGFSVQTRAIAFEFHRKRTLFKLPTTLWLTTIAIGNVKISTFASSEQPSALVFQLEALRLKASGHEGGVVPGAAEEPAVRVVRRSQ